MLLQWRAAGAGNMFAPCIIQAAISTAVISRNFIKLHRFRCRRWPARRPFWTACGTSPLRLMRPTARTRRCCAACTRAWKTCSQALVTQALCAATTCWMQSGEHGRCKAVIPLSLAGGADVHFGGADVPYVSTSSEHLTTLGAQGPPRRRAVVGRPARRSGGSGAVD